MIHPKSMQRGDGFCDLDVDCPQLIASSTQRIICIQLRHCALVCGGLSLGLVAVSATVHIVDSVPSFSFVLHSSRYRSILFKARAYALACLSKDSLSIFKEYTTRSAITCLLQGSERKIRRWQRLLYSFTRSFLNRGWQHCLKNGLKQAVPPAPSMAERSKGLKNLRPLSRRLTLMHKRPPRISNSSRR